MGNIKSFISPMGSSVTNNKTGKFHLPEEATVKTLYCAHLPFSTDL